MTVPTSSATAHSPSRVAVAFPSGTTDVEAARAFLQDRLRLWAFWVFVLSSGFYLTNLVMWASLGPSFRKGLSVWDLALQPGPMVHVAASLFYGVVWLMTRRLRLSYQALHRLDATALVGGGILFASMGLYLFRVQILWLDRTVGLFAGLLAIANTVMARTIFVPSTSSRTLWLSAAAFVPMIPVTVGATGTVAAVMNVMCWAAVSVAIATVGSRVIFGLRTEAARVRRLGQYTLEEKIGAGGMGVVYRASHAMLRRPTAIKLLPPDRAGEANLLRFEREVQLTSQLSHPNTIAIYDYGRTPEGVFYYAMEYLDGIDLDELVRQDGPQPAGRVIAILEQVCGALAEAHGCGLVHRDIKPANIILTERGGEPDVAKVVDFGLVKPLTGTGVDITSAASVITGTPLYMAPEALSVPESSDPRSDLYAVGAVGYLLVSGHPVFEAKGIYEIIGHHLHSEPTPPSRRTSVPVPADLEALLLRCLRKQPEERPADARTMRDELRRLSAAGTWTSGDAASWWKTFRSRSGSTTRRPLAMPSTLTVSVDVGERLTRA